MAESSIARSLNLNRQSGFASFVNDEIVNSKIAKYQEWRNRQNDFTKFVSDGIVNSGIALYHK